MVQNKTNTNISTYGKQKYYKFILYLVVLVLIPLQQH